jgi:hypothetical protein
MTPHVNRLAPLMTYIVALSSGVAVMLATFFALPILRYWAVGIFVAYSGVVAVWVYRIRCWRCGWPIIKSRSVIGIHFYAQPSLRCRNCGANLLRSGPD